VSFPKSMLTDFIGTLSEEKLKQLNEALKIALAIK
jgi:mRNA-degrading endonuclease toxin of MazEF toxin-antitoxin module